MQRRYSRQRELILNCVRSSVLHPTADDVYRMVSPLSPNLSRGTVYRNLNLLAEEGILQRMPFTIERYDGRTDHHPHFVCECCGEVTDVEVAYEEELNTRVSRSTGNQVSYHSAYFHGICAQCIEKGRQ